jgi:lysophospholipase L1-like esterase
MALEIFANLSQTTVTSGGGSAPSAGTQETWTVNSSASFLAASSSAAAPTKFHVTDAQEPDELIAVINVSGTTWTVIRGVQGTVPIPHAAGFTVYQPFTAGWANKIGTGAQPWITLPGNWYAGAWFTAKASNFSSPAWILFDGDSVTNGLNPANSGYLATGWPDQLRTSLLASTAAAVYGDFYAIWGYTFGAGAADPVNEGFATPLTGSTQYEGGFGSCLTNGSNNTWFQILTTSQIPGWTGGNVTGFDLVYYDFGSCTWGFTIDGGQGGSPTVSGATWNGSMWVVTNTGGSFAAGNVKKVTVRGLTSGSHVIEYGQVSSAGNCMWIGLSLFTGNTGGIGFVRSAYSGRRAVDAACAAGSGAGYAGTLSTFPNDKIALWSGSGPTNATAQITPAPFGFPTQPALAFIGFGINDAACFIAPGAYGDAIERRIIALRRGVANANIALVAMSYPDVHNSDNNLPGDGQRYVRYKNVLAELATAYSCAYVDIDAKWGGTPVGQGFQVSGNVHPTAAGHADIASLIAGII